MRQSNDLHLEHLGVKVGSVFPPKYPDNTCSHGTTPTWREILVTASYLLPQHVDGVISSTAVLLEFNWC